ncbi:WhiB family transcriptional regulator [Streptomyces aidingensis]|uniref:Transcriptional regulator WhiB n=1 Tax=Streptomyces aidingensis TaxID=910347 RepID=A0A1I1KEI4_9ACTN|nr:WhiB family transcriptional regulator [Streptomyces aidingensis]SFC59209.1 WhiB family transcriptional regulator, redox-sensing transcriptional regulator [Streptomyces aidingensis]
MDTSPTSPAHRTLGDHTWQTRAACLPTEANPVDPEIFFPEPEETDRIATAKALCAQCPVRRTCLDAALENGDRHGIRGGLTEEERDPLHRKIRARLDYARVNAVLAGRDIHLTDAERQAVARAAYQAGTPATRLAWLLKVTEEHAEKLYRRVRRQVRNRSLSTTEQRPTRRKPGRPSRSDLGQAA